MRCEPPCSARSSYRVRSLRSSYTGLNSDHPTRGCIPRVCHPQPRFVSVCVRIPGRMPGACVHHASPCHAIPLGRSRCQTSEAASFPSLCSLRQRFAPRHFRGRVRNEFSQPLEPLKAQRPTNPEIPYRPDPTHSPSDFARADPARMSSHPNSP